MDFRDFNEITIISDEIGKSKPATLFFLSKYGCLIENIKFYSKVTLSDTFDSFDVIITSNPDLLSLKNNNTVRYWQTNEKNQFEFEQSNHISHKAFEHT